MADWSGCSKYSIVSFHVNTLAGSCPHPVQRAAADVAIRREHSRSAAGIVGKSAKRAIIVGMVENRTRGQVVLKRVKWCSSFACRLRGLTFRRSLPAEEGLLLVEDRASIVATAIHMFFVFFPIAAVWLDDSFRVVDAKLARPFRPLYASRAPARYVLEADPALLQDVSIGDQLFIAR